MSSRFLFTCWSFEGHVFPQLSIATALRDRGDEVAFFTAESARATIEREGFLVRTALAGLADAPVEVIATTGPQRSAKWLALGRQQRNAHVTDWLGHTELLPRCRAVVTNGGAGTIMAALHAGAPLVVVPTTWDKPDNARRVVEAGVGVRISPRRCTPKRLRAAVDHVLEERSYRNAAQTIARRLAAAPGPAGAAELLEALVAAPIGATVPRGAR